MGRDGKDWEGLGKRNYISVGKITSSAVCHFLSFPVISLLRSAFLAAKKITGAISLRNVHVLHPPAQEDTPSCRLVYHCLALLSKPHVPFLSQKVAGQIPTKQLLQSTLPIRCIQSTDILTWTRRFFVYVPLQARSIFS